MKVKRREQKGVEGDGRECKEKYGSRRGTKEWDERKTKGMK